MNHISEFTDFVKEKLFLNNKYILICKKNIKPVFYISERFLLHLKSYDLVKNYSDIILNFDIDNEQYKLTFLSWDNIYSCREIKLFDNEEQLKTDYERELLYYCVNYIDKQSNIK